MILAGCSDAEQTTGATAGLGEACASAAGCEAELSCLAQSAGNVCVATCQTDDDCVAGTCDPLRGLSHGWCNVDGVREPEPEPDNNGKEPEPDNNGQEPEPEPGPRAIYPDGPYGTGIGDVMAAEQLETRDGEAFRLADVYADEDNKLLLIFSTAQWCGRCVADLPDLERFHAAYSDQGLYTMVSIFENLNYEPAIGANAGRYQDRHSVSFTTVADPSGTLHKYFDRVALPMVLVVDIETMTVISSDVGWYPSQVEATIEDNL